MVTALTIKVNPGFAHSGPFRLDELRRTGPPFN